MIQSNSKSDSIPQKKKKESSETSNHLGGGGWWWEHVAVVEDGVDAGAEAVPEPPVVGGGAGERHGGRVHGTRDALLKGKGSGQRLLFDSRVGVSERGRGGSGGEEL
jgi:hypothetical protein